MSKATILLVLIAISIFGSNSGAQNNVSHDHQPCVDDGLPLGTEGKMHACLHRAYQAFTEASKQAELGTKNGLSDTLKKGYEDVFSTLKCHCSTGQCRPTEPFRWNNARHRLEGLVDGHWVHIPQEALKRVDMTKVRPDILAEMLSVSSAHICAIPEVQETDDGRRVPIPGKYKVECAWQLTAS